MQSKPIPWPITANREAVLRRSFLADGDCWRWTGPFFQHGYGLFFVNGRSCLAHRVVYELFHGLVPPDLELDHLCRNIWCVNPEHLEPVTHTENMRRSRPAIKTHCPHGHELIGWNLLPSKTGHRACRTCCYARNRIRRDALFVPKITCRNGHALTEDLAYYPPGSSARSCRLCRRMASVNFRQRRRLARA